MAGDGVVPRLLHRINAEVDMASEYASTRRSVFELVLGGRANQPTGFERTHLLLEDLVDAPIELTLSDFGALTDLPQPAVPVH